jgi:hypothetical protein
VEKLSNKRRNMGERVKNEEEISWIILLHRYEFKFQGKKFFLGGEKVNPLGEKS